jgi:flagellar L-ring protein precursor FlgH
MINKGLAVLLFAGALAGRAEADSGLGSIWGHPNGLAAVSTAGQSNIYSDPLAHSVGDLVTIVVDLQNQITKAQNTTTAKDTAVSAIINSLLYPNDGSNKGYNFLNYHGQNPTASWTSSQSFNGGGTVNNQETASTTIQARVVGVLRNGVLEIEARRFSKAGQEDTAMTLTGLVRPEDLSSTNTISSSMVADLQILQKGKGTLTDDQKKGWFTKLYEFLEPF